ncbi:MAG: ATP-binding protein, partial [Candidatus Hodarchaeota archaeon]
MSNDPSEMDDYSMERVRVLRGPEVVRQRPAMYIGTTSSKGIYYMVQQVLDRALEEVMAGYCTEIKVIIHKDQSITVVDNARGILLDKHPIHKRSIIETLIEDIFDRTVTTHNPYEMSGGMHGFGLGIVCVLSTSFLVQVKQDRKIYQQEYRRGEKVSELIVLGKCDRDETGTAITFLPDETIFDSIKLDREIIKDRLRELAFLNKGIKFSLRDERLEEAGEVEYYNTRGVVAFVEYLSEEHLSVHKPLYFQHKRDSLVIEIAMNYTTDYDNKLYGFVNNINTQEGQGGGTHIEGLNHGLKQAI